MSKKTVRRSLTMTQEMRDRLALLVSKQPRDTTEADLIHTIFPHPTLSETMHEAVLAAYGRAVHI